MLEFRPLTEADKHMANGSRCLERTPLSDRQIAFVLKEAERIKVDTSLLQFNEVLHIRLNNTCYNFKDDLIYIAKNVFPDNTHGSLHPRDLMSVGAVLAHEYYGHRTYREEYLQDAKTGKQTTPLWEDECRASITAAKLAPNLTDVDRVYLILDAVKRAEEAGHSLRMDDWMKGVVYGDYSDAERNITPRLTPLEYDSLEG